jgi:hypothetical protein
MSFRLFTDWRPQFTIRTMLVVTFFVAAWCSLTKVWPHVGILVAAIVATTIATYYFFRVRRSMRGQPRSVRSRVALAVMFMLALMAWLLLYAASAGPVIAISFWMSEREPICGF